MQAHRYGCVLRAFTQGKDRDVWLRYAGDAVLAQPEPYIPLKQTPPNRAGDEHDTQRSDPD